MSESEGRKRSIEEVDKQVQTDSKKQCVDEKLTLRAVGFCGVDDSVDVDEMLQISSDNPYVEWGFLFRPEKQGLPRFATMDFIEKLCGVLKANPDKYKNIKLAGHLCSTKVEDALNNKTEFIKKLASLGFKRVQINATKANGVDTSNLTEQAPLLFKTIQEIPNLEFIIQKNNETKPLWEYLLAKESKPDNMSILFDESVGTGVECKVFQKPLEGVPVGYAGGIGPSNIISILSKVRHVTSEHQYKQAVWVDMESSLRTVTGDRDIFDLSKVKSCCSAINQDETVVFI